MSAAADGRTILAPNTELAAALFDAVERAHLSAGRELWATPRVLDFGAWLREQHALRQMTDAHLPRILGEVEERELWRAVIEESPAAQELLEPAGAARAARRARRALYEYGIPLQAVARHAAASEESRIFLDWNRRFEERLQSLGCISADELPGRVGASEPSIVWIESPVWRPMARQWLERHGLMLAPRLQASGAAGRLNAASPAAELAAIADWARVNLEAEPGFRAWVCIPDLQRRRADVIDAFDAALAPQRFLPAETQDAAPYAVAGGTPLAGFAPVRAALNLLAASVGPVAFEDFSMLLRAPELHATEADAGAAAALDLHLRERGTSEADLPAWLALADRLAAARGIGPIAALQRLHGARQALGDLRGSHSFSQWVPAWLAALEAGPWALRHRWSSTEFQAAERLRELLASLATADSIFGSHSRQSAQAILRRAAQDTAFQVQTGVPPVWVSGRLIDPWLTYDGLWVAACDDQRWPPAVDPIPLLPVRLQREFGVAAAAPETQLQFALELQSRWRARADRCVFSHADPGDGRKGSPSPLLPDAAFQASPALPRPHWRALMEGAPLLERFTDELAPPFGVGERTRGVSTLKAQSRCAFRGFAQTRLRCEGLERPVPGFNERERGELIHHALEHIWSDLRNSAALLALSPDAEACLLNIAVTHALAEVCRLRDPGPRWRRRERERMTHVLTKWLDAERRRQPFEVERLEHGAHLLRANLDFSVRIDRVDRLADGARVLIDYKTGNAGADWRGARPDNPQLPVYALLHPEALVAVAYGRVNAGECGFIAETERKGIFREHSRASTLEGEPSFESLIAVWSQRIESLAADFAAGRAAVAPTLAACRTCRLQGLCRVPAALEDAADSHE